MNKRRIMICTAGFWFLAVCLWGFFYVYTKITAIDATPGYETMWTFQSCIFAFTRLPLAVFLLVAILLGEYLICGRKKVTDKKDAQGRFVVGTGHMKKLIVTITLAVAIALVGYGWWICVPIFFNEELASKQEWSAVQIIELQHRDNPSDQIEFVVVGKYSIVGLPVRDARRKIWIMLNPRKLPYYKQLPKGNYTLSKEDFGKILASGVVSSTVEECLDSHVGDSKMALESGLAK